MSKKSRRKSSNRDAARKSETPTPDSDSLEPTNKPAESSSENSGARSVSSEGLSIRIAAPTPIGFARYFSFAMLLGVIVLVGVLFYEVMVGFFIPLFLAMILVVIFRPLHKWIASKFNDRPSIAALSTTVIVLLMVLVPLAVVLILAAVEGQEAVSRFNVAQFSEGAIKIRSKLHLELPRSITVIEREMKILEQYKTLSVESEDMHRLALFEAESAARELSATINLDWPGAKAETPAANEESTKPDLSIATWSESTRASWEAFANKLIELRKRHRKMDWSSSDDSEVYQRRMTELHDYQLLLDQANGEFGIVKNEILGGKTRAWVTRLVNPSREQSDKYFSALVSFLQENLFSIGGKGVAFVGSLVISTAIMVIAFYFFLLDGPAMLETFKGLSPIDDDHEQELVSEFANVSRAVVVATLLSALAQGLLAGIGFYFVGLDSVFLLTVMSAVLAMVPFVGAASVWIPCALYLYFVDNNLTAAIGLAIYGVAVISMADNIIKPLVLHGQSNIHPLLAFLSVIGGVGALGPIGILIGPMVVAFLQTLLKILRQEMFDLSQTSAES